MREIDVALDPFLPSGFRLLPRLGGVQLFVLSFLALIAVGTVGLLFLPGLYTGARLGVVDALFTATSAVCVTGLIVVDTATWFTPLGQAWILALVQAGGLGILTFTTLIVVAMGRRGSLRLEEATASHASYLRQVDTERLVRTVILGTLAVEAVGAIWLWVLWRDRLGSVGAIWPALFHSVSAFCNAGFSIFSDSLVGFAGSPGTLFAMAILIVVGGLGFIVLEDVRARWLARTSRRLSVHSRVVLWTTGALLLAGWTMFLGFEWFHTLAPMDILDRVVNALFMSVTARTAGFNTLDYDALSNATLFLTMILMVIGGSPGSTAGGLKTTTFALLILLLVTRLRGRRVVQVFDRAVPRETVQRAAGLAVGGLAVLGSAIFALLFTETGTGGETNRAGLVRLVFEVHSAFGTVGLSMGATADLTPEGRVLMSALMLFGRLGPLAVAAAMTAAVRRRHPGFRYGEEDVILA